VTIENFEKILAAHPFFEGIEKTHLETIVGCAANVTFEAGDFIFRDGAAADRFYVLRHGKVGVEVFVPGSGAVRVETLQDGEVLGWSWLFPPYKAHFDARALTFVRALSLDGACLRDKCEKDPAFGYDLMKRFAPILIQRLDATRMQLLDLYGSHA
jgi:CRP/FNR family transcriptional regulator, cyclic AMP receptor protein